MEELEVAGSVKTQYNFEPLTIEAEAFEDESLTTIFSPVSSANVIMGDIEACKVCSQSLNLHINAYHSKVCFILCLDVTHVKQRLFPESYPKRE